MLVLFDLDGVLVDSRTPFARCVNHALEQHGVAPRPDHELHRYLGPPLHATMLELTRDDATAAACVDAYRARYRATAAAETSVFDGVQEALARIGAGATLAVATSKPAALAAPLVEAVGLAGHFAAVVGPDLAAEAETKTTTVTRALAAVPQATGYAMVGDRSFDMAAARAHGLLAVGVTWGIGDEAELREAGADVIVHEPHELPDALVPARRQPGTSST